MLAYIPASWILWEQSVRVHPDEVVTHCLKMLQDLAKLRNAVEYPVAKDSNISWMAGDMRQDRQVSKIYWVHFFK
jgi:hypothetical protein